MKKSATALSPEAKGSSRRLQQLASLMRAELGKLMTREVEFPAGTLVTITEVCVLPDYKEAHVKVSVLPFERGAEVLTILQRILPRLQHELNTTITMFHVPKVVVRFDDTPERADRLEHLLDSIKQEE